MCNRTSFALLFCPRVVRHLASEIDFAFSEAAPGVHRRSVRVEGPKRKAANGSKAV